VEPRIAREPDRKIPDGNEFLDLDAALVQPRLAEGGVKCGDLGRWLGTHDATLSWTSEIAGRDRWSVRGYTVYRILDEEGKDSWT
jgi:hypothetical protein